MCILFVYAMGIENKKQGELVDNVEHHVQSTVDYVEKGHLELVQAEKYQSKARKVFFFYI